MAHVTTSNEETTLLPLSFFLDPHDTFETMHVTLLAIDGYGAANLYRFSSGEDVVCLELTSEEIEEMIAQYTAYQRRCSASIGREAK